MVDPVVADGPCVQPRSISFLLDNLIHVGLLRPFQVALGWRRVLIGDRRGYGLWRFQKSYKPFVSSQEE